MSSGGSGLADRQADFDLEVGQQLQFERLIAELIARFVRVAPDGVDTEIEDSLRRIVEALDLDRSTLLQTTESGDLEVTHSWTLPGLTPVTNVLVARDFPWTLSRARRGEATLVTRIDDMPAEAAPDREALRRLDNKSTMVIPLLSRGDLIGALAFGSIRTERAWPASLIPRLQLIADVLAGALIGKRADIELQRSIEENKRLRERLREENTYLREESRRGIPNRIIGQSAALQGVLKLVEQVAPTQAPVLVLGETGVGKELIAEAVHARSTRRDRLMVKVNCAALPASLVESELFGREKGAYTGALTKQIGRFELAHQGTLFLDEVAELPLELQAKLLRVLQHGEFERLGSSRTVKVDVRVVAATNRDLEKAVAEGRFRDDLYYRLAVFPITVPPLRERPEDISLLVRSAIDEVARNMGKRITEVAAESLERLARYAWPGNVRELRNVIERAIIVSSDDVLRIDLPDRRGGAETVSLTLADAEQRHIVSVLERTGWRVRGDGGAAAILGIPPTTLETRMAKLGVRRPPRVHGVS